MKEIKISVKFDDKWSVKSVNEDLSCKLIDLVKYHGFKITTDACKSFWETDEEANKRLNEGETFYDF